MNVEKEILGHLASEDGLRRIWDAGVRPEHFADPMNRAVITFALDYWLDTAMTQSPTKEVLEHEFPSLELTETEESVTWLIDKVKDKYVTNELQDVIRGAASKVHDEPHETLSELYSQTWDITSKVTPRISRSDLSENVEVRRQRYLERAAYKGEVRGAPIGLKEMDDHTSGILPGELIAVAGYAKTGKSHFLCNTVKEMRLQGWTPYFATLELSVAEMEDRMDAHLSGIGYGKIQKGTLDRHEIETLRQKQDEFAELGSTFIEKPPRGERTVQHLVSRARDLGADALVIDQLSFVESRGRAREKTYMIEEIMEDLKSEISEDESRMMPCVLAVQFNRGAASTKGARGGMENIANSSSIERTVDMAIGLTQSKEMRANKSMVAEIMGNRRGAPGAWLLEWSLGGQTKIGVRGTYED